MATKFFFHFDNIITSNFSAIIGTGNLLSSQNDIAEYIGYNISSLAIPQQIHSKNVLFVRLAAILL